MTSLGWICLIEGAVILLGALGAAIWIEVLRRQSAQLELEACTLRRKLRASSQVVEAEIERVRIEGMSDADLARAFDARPDSGAT